MAKQSWLIVAWAILAVIPGSKASDRPPMAVVTTQAAPIESRRADSLSESNTQLQESLRLSRTRAVNQPSTPANARELRRVPAYRRTEDDSRPQDPAADTDSVAPGGQHDDPPMTAGICPSVGNCCENHGGTGCDDALCCDLVCSADASCCSAIWDSGCVDLAQILCDGVCPSPDCPGAGDCCTANGDGGCEDGCCCQAVCDSNPECCATEWTVSCADTAADLCPGLCSPSLPQCPGTGDCFASNSTPGCDDETCCNLVCAQDSICCNQRWDSICAADAQDICNCPVSLCPGEGGLCCQSNGTSGCDDPECCATVCAADPACCATNNGWDAICMNLAQSLCKNLCGCNSFGDFDDNGFVNLADSAGFLNCFTGALVEPMADGCACADSNDDGAVDLTDFGVFFGLFNQ